MVEMIAAIPSLIEVSSSNASDMEIEEKEPLIQTLYYELFTKKLKNFDEKYDRAKEKILPSMN